jgi:hypothetical protein
MAEPAPKNAGKGTGNYNERWAVIPALLSAFGIRLSEKGMEYRDAGKNPVHYPSVRITTFYKIRVRVKMIVGA